MCCLVSYNKIIFLQCITESYHFKFKYTNMGPQMDILRFVQRLFVDDVLDLFFMITGAGLFCMIAGTTMWQCMWRWRIPREPQCCLFGSSFCSYRIWMLSPATSTSPWISTTMTTVSVCYSLLLVLRTPFEMSLPVSPSVTPANYQPPGFKAGKCDSVWFEGVMTNFEVGEVQTGLHTIRIHVSAEQGRLKKLLEENHLEQTMQVPHTFYLQTEGIEVGIQSSAFQQTCFIVRAL